MGKLSSEISCQTAASPESLANALFSMADFVRRAKSVEKLNYSVKTYFDETHPFNAGKMTIKFATGRRHYKVNLIILGEPQEY